MYNNSQTSYGSVARTLHWLTAGVILINIGLGLVAYRLSVQYIDAKVQLFSAHKTLGIAAILIATLRILWALTQTRPLPVHPERRLETFAAETAHWLLYVSMILVPLTGWMEHAATEGYAPILWPFGQGLPFIPKSESLAVLFATIHQVFAWLLILTVLAHVAGALKHALIDRDGVLARMLSGRSVQVPNTVERHVLPAIAAAIILAAGGGYAYMSRPEAIAEAPKLEQVASDWVVNDGSVTFSLNQMGTTINGKFDDWTAVIAFDETTGTGEVTATINMASLTVGTVSDQAKGADFLDVAAHPSAVFRAAISPEGDAFRAKGNLTMKGVEIPVDLPFTLSVVEGKATMSGQTTLDRRNWGVGDGYSDESTLGFSVALNVALTATRMAP